MSSLPLKHPKFPSNTSGSPCLWGFLQTCSLSKVAQKVPLSSKIPLFWARFYTPMQHIWQEFCPSTFPKMSVHFVLPLVLPPSKIVTFSHKNRGASHSPKHSSILTPFKCHSNGVLSLLLARYLPGATNKRRLLDNR